MSTGPFGPLAIFWFLLLFLFDSGNSDLDQVLKVLMGTAMFVGGVLAFFLDNTVPGEETRIIVSYFYVSRAENNLK